MMLTVCFDGDSVGAQVGRLALADDVAGVRIISQKIDLGNNIFSSWAKSKGGSVINIGGDEGRFSIPAQALEELPKIREQYMKAIGFTVSVGVGMKLSEANMALVAAKLRGKDRIVLYTPHVLEEVKAAQKQVHSEASKLSEQYLDEKPTLAEEFGSVFHQHAQQTHTQHKEAKAQELQQVKEEIVQVLQTVKEKAPELTHLKLVSPEAYAALQNTIRVMLALAKQVIGE